MIELFDIIYMEVTCIWMLFFDIILQIRGRVLDSSARIHTGSDMYFDSIFDIILQISSARIHTGSDKYFDIIFDIILQISSARIHTGSDMYFDIMFDIVLQISSARIHTVAFSPTDCLQGYPRR